MTEQPEPEKQDVRIDLMRTLDMHGRRVLLLTAATTLIVAFAGLVYLLWGQTSLTTASMEFRPTFSGASQGKYPNDLPFAVSDITASSVIDKVFADNQLQNYCSVDAFKSGIFVDQFSAQYAFLDAEYQAKLADPRLTAVDRDRLQNEYVTRREALPLQYRLIFTPGGACGGIPDVTLRKMLADVLSVWAEQSESRRGVLRLQVQVLTPNVLDVGLTSEGSRLIRADLIRSALRRLVNNVREVEDKPGAALVRSGQSGTTFAEVRGRFEDLIQARLEPLVVMAGRGLGAESLAWVDEALAGANQEQTVAEGRARAYLSALREYSGVPQSGPASLQPQPSGSSSDVQTLTPQIDRTFIDRILEMSDANITFRQELTEGMVAADVQALESRAKVGYYMHLASALRGSGGLGLTGAEVDAKLTGIVRDGQALAQQFNKLYDEWSTIALRPGPGLYQVTKPAEISVSRPFSVRSLVFTIAAVFLLTLAGALAFFIMRDIYRDARRRRALAVR